MSPRRLGLRGQIVAGLAFALVVAIVLVSVAMLGIMQRAMVAQAQRNAESLAQTASTTVAASLDPERAFADPENLGDFARICQLFGEAHPGARVVVTERRADVLRAVASWPPGLRVELPVAPRHLEAFSQGQLDSRVVARDGLRLIEVFAPVLLTSGELAAVIVEIPLQSVQRMIASSQRAILLYIALDALLLLIIGYLVMTRGVVRPIARITAATQRIADGDFDTRIDVAATNEIGDLATNFDAMVVRLRDGRETLNRRLEELAAANQALAAAQREVVRAERMATLGSLAAGIAHEIGNPLAAITGLLELVEDREGVPEEMVDDLVRRVQDEVARLNRIVAELLDYARVKEATPGPLDVRDAIAQAIRLCAHHPRARSLTIRFERPDTAPFALVDEGRLVQVMLNLLVNAADACAETAATVTVSLAALEEHVEIAVADTGPGIPPEVIPRLFEPFFTTKASGEGTGLGLAICERIVSEVGGAIEVESALGVGTTFRVRFRRASSTPPEPHSGSSP